MSYRELFLVFGLIVICGLCPADAQQDTTYQERYEVEYARRIAMTHINGRYIPRDVNEAMVRLDKLVDPVGKAKFKAQHEETAVKKIHFSFGRWIIYNWGFYEGSRLSHQLKKIGITYPDDMARTIMTCYHRHLHGKPLEVEKLADHFAEIRKKEVQSRLLEGQVIERLVKPKN